MLRFSKFSRGACPSLAPYMGAIGGTYFPTFLNYFILIVKTKHIT